MRPGTRVVVRSTTSDRSQNATSIAKRIRNVCTFRHGTSMITPSIPSRPSGPRARPRRFGGTSTAASTSASRTSHCGAVLDGDTPGPYRRSRHHGHRRPGEAPGRRYHPRVTSVDAAPADSSTSGALTYQPALDGLRALAVAAVVAFHLDEGRLTGGFLGVDAFFVLSGFLITTLLVLEWRRRAGIGLLAFWGRRARRLLPALLLLMLAVAIFAAIEVPTDELGRLRGDGIAGLFYVANWRFVASGQSYFDLFASPSPFRHLWSLAIEEQFYLVWPLITLGCLRLARGRLRVLAGVAVAGVLASTVLMAVLYQSDDPSRAYYGTDTHAHPILIGVLLALVLIDRAGASPGARRAFDVAGVVALAGM